MYLRACPLKLELGRPIQLAAQESKSHLAELVGSSKDGGIRGEQWLTRIDGRRGERERERVTSYGYRGDWVCDMIMLLIFLF